jgi:hypothetical protein
MARKKKNQNETQAEVQDQPDKDIFDEDEENESPPTLDPGHPDAQDAPVASQDAPGDVPTILKDESTQADPERVPGDSEKAANERLLDTKGDLQPVVDQKKFLQGPAGVEAGNSVDMNDPAIREAFKRFLAGEPRGDTGKKTIEAYKVVRGMVGAFPEGTVVTDVKALGGAEALPRLLESGVILPYQMEEKS